MCLEALHVKPKVAKEDIVCYKIMYYKPRNKYKTISIYRLFKYVLGVTYKITNFKRDTDGYIDEAFHAYRSIEETVKTFKYLGRWYSGSKIFECTIPKGSLYYLGRGQEIASNQIIINKVL